MYQVITAAIVALTTTVAGTDTLQRDVDAIRDTGAVGVQARVTGGTVATSGVSDLRTGQPVNPDGEFRIGSAGKTFTAVVVMQLVAEGRLSLDGSAEKWLPAAVRGHGITVRQLLQHKSGIQDDIPGWETAEDYYEQRYDIYTPQQLVDRAMSRGLAFAPGKGWRYTSTGYLVLGMIVERVTGNTSYDEIRRRIIEPLGLNRTYWPGLRPGLRAPYAHGYMRFPDGRLVDVTRHRWAYAASQAGGMVSTTADLDRFYRALLGGRLVGPAQLAQMMKAEPVSADFEALWPGVRNGLGLFSRPLTCGGEYWGHMGDIEGYMTREGFSADGRRGVVVSVSTTRNDSFDAFTAQDKAASDLVDHALCAR